MKLYQNNRLLYCGFWFNVAFTFLRLYMHLIRIKYVSLPNNVDVTAACCIRSTPVYWYRLWSCRYRTDIYLPSSYSRSENLFRTLSITNIFVTLHKNHSNLECYYAVLQRPITELFRSHSFHSFQQHCNQQSYQRVCDRTRTA